MSNIFEYKGKKYEFIEETVFKNEFTGEWITIVIYKSLLNGSEIDELTGKKMNSSTMAFAWFVWEIGYEGEPIIRWL